MVYQVWSMYNMDWLEGVFYNEKGSKELHRYILDWYRDIIVLLEVLFDNKAAVKLYKKMYLEVVFEKDGFSLSSANDKSKCSIKKESDERAQTW